MLRNAHVRNGDISHKVRVTSTSNVWPFLWVGSRICNTIPVAFTKLISRRASAFFNHMARFYGMLIDEPIPFFKEHSRC